MLRRKAKGPLLALCLRGRESWVAREASNGKGGTHLERRLGCGHGRGQKKTVLAGYLSPW